MLLPELKISVHKVHKYTNIQVSPLMPRVPSIFSKQRSSMESSQIQGTTQIQLQTTQTAFREVHSVKLSLQAEYITNKGNCHQNTCEQVRVEQRRQLCLSCQFAILGKSSVTSSHFTLFTKKSKFEEKMIKQSPSCHASIKIDSLDSLPCFPSYRFNVVFRLHKNGGWRGVLKLSH